MSEFAEFSRDLLESAKFLLGIARDEKAPKKQQAYMRSSLYHALSYVEAQVNDVADHFENDETLSKHEKGFLLERSVNFEVGQFEISKSLKMTRLIDRIEFLLVRHGGTVQDVQGLSGLKASLKLRNTLAHPKDAKSLSESEVQLAIDSSVSVCDAIAKAVFGKSLPYVDRGLEPTSDYS